ncbi:MAG TPA: glycine oxidase ThiO [Ktedonobacteraceae bacterium]|nr:glycine oxidase ThiO [Ktedonobacteraceae bacterium]
MATKQATEVAIVGGGVEGCSIAYQLSKAGVQASVFERAEIAAEASSAAAGLLAPAGVLTGPKEGAALFLASWSMTPALIKELEAVSGVQVEYQVTGSLHVVTELDGEAGLRRYEQAWREHGANVNWITGDELHQFEPLLHPEIDAALSIPHAASIRPRLVTRAYAEAARKLGAQFYEQTEVTGFRQSGGKVTGIETAQGGQQEIIDCERVVIATGAWSARVGSWLGLDIPVFPARGQILSLKQPATPLRHTIFGRGLYLVPKVDNTIYVGATVEQVGFDKSNTAGGLAWLLSTAIELLPELYDAALAHIWTGLRPWSGDGYPILGKAPGWENVFLATGHGAGGFELSAITGKTMAELLTTGQTPPLIQPFGLERFNGQSLNDISLEASY